VVQGRQGTRKEGMGHHGNSGAGKRKEIRVNSTNTPPPPLVSRIFTFLIPGKSSDCTPCLSTCSQNSIHTSWPFVFSLSLNPLHFLE
jgi:hypothetical protein